MPFKINVTLTPIFSISFRNKKMNDDLTLFSSPKLKDVVQDLRELLSQGHLAFLLGAGCSKKAGLPLMFELTDEVLKHEKIGKETQELLDKIRKFFSGAGSATIEDYMSEIVDFLSIAERRTQCGATQSKVSLGDQEKDATEFQTALDEIKQAISSSIGDKEVDVVTMDCSYKLPVCNDINFLVAN